GSIVAFHPEFQPPRDFPGAAYQWDRLIGRCFEQLQLKTDEFQCMQHVAVSFFVLDEKSLMRTKCGSPFIRAEQRQKIRGAIAEREQDPVQLLRSEFFPM